MPRLGLGELSVELREAGVGQALEEDFEALVAPRLDERGDEEEIQPARRLGAGPAGRAQRRDVPVPAFRRERRAVALRLPRGLAEVRELLGRERRERVREARHPRVRPDERQRVHGGLELADGVVARERPGGSPARGRVRPRRPASGSAAGSPSRRGRRPRGALAGRLALRRDGRRRRPRPRGVRRAREEARRGAEVRRAGEDAEEDDALLAEDDEREAGEVLAVPDGPEEVPEEKRQEADSAEEDLERERPPGRRARNPSEVPSAPTRLARPARPIAARV